MGTWLSRSDQVTKVVQKLLGRQVVQHLTRIFWRYHLFVWTYCPDPSTLVRITRIGSCNTYE